MGHFCSGQEAPVLAPLPELNLDLNNCTEPTGLNQHFEMDYQQGEPIANLNALIPTIVPDDVRLQSDVINLSHVILSNDQITVLSYGLHFRRMPRKIPYIQLLAGAELAAQDLARSDPIVANTFQISCSNLIQHAELPYPNLMSPQKRAWKDLQSNEAIMILSADKGGKVVILDTLHYGAMCLAHLENPAYELVSSFGHSLGKVELRDSEGTILENFVDTDYSEMDSSDKRLHIQCRRLANLLSSLRNTGEISVEDKKKLVLSSPYSGTIPRFHGLPKIHKIGILKIRPIV